jgi:uncharacterized membrane protein required for colicin V production
MNYFDLIIVLVLLIAFYSGYKNGLIKTIFRTTGYIAGGVAGMALAVEYLATWESQTQKFVLALLAIFIGASVGEFLFGKIGTLFRKVLFVPPLKVVDSLLGAGLSVLRAAVIIYLILSLFIFSPWVNSKEYVKSSRLYSITWDFIDSEKNVFPSEKILGFFNSEQK